MLHYNVLYRFNIDIDIDSETKTIDFMTKIKTKLFKTKTKQFSFSSARPGSQDHTSDVFLCYVAASLFYARVLCA